MPITLEFGGIELTGDTESQPGQVRPDGPGGVRIGVIADLRGRGQLAEADPGQPLAARRIIRVDRDNLDELPGKLGVELSLTLPGGDRTPIVLAFRELDDFHPDRLLARADVFAHLGSLRPRLEAPPTSAEAAAELAPASGKTGHDPAPPAASPSSVASTPPEDLLDQI